MEVNTKNTLSASFLWTEIRFPRPNIWQFLTEIKERAKEKLWRISSPGKIQLKRSKFSKMVMFSR